MNACTYIYARMHTWIYTGIYTYIHDSYMYTFIYVYIYTYIHIYINITALHLAGKACGGLGDIFYVAAVIIKQLGLYIFVLILGFINVLPQHPLPYDLHIFVNIYVFICCCNYHIYIHI
jgi:hypothetical protein